MKRHGATLALVLILGGSALIVSCTKPYHEENERYVFVATNVNLPYWQNAEAGFLDAAKALGVKAELTGPPGYQPNAELGVFRRVLEENPTGNLPFRWETRNFQSRDRQSDCPRHPSHLRGCGCAGFEKSSVYRNR